MLLTGIYKIINTKNNKNSTSQSWDQDSVESRIWKRTKDKPYNKAMGIYKITNLKNNKAYIGQASGKIGARITQHYNPNNSSSTIDRAITKESEGSFKWEILADSLKDSDDLNYWEKFYIDTYQSRNSQFGYNSSGGGFSNNSFLLKKHQPEIIKALKTVWQLPELRDPIYWWYRGHIEGKKLWTEPRTYNGWKLWSPQVLEALKTLKKQHFESIQKYLKLEALWESEFYKKYYELLPYWIQWKEDEIREEEKERIKNFVINSKLNKVPVETVDYWINKERKVKDYLRHFLPTSQKYKFLETTPKPNLIRESWYWWNTNKENDWSSWYSVAYKYFSAEYKSYWGN